MDIFCPTCQMKLQIADAHAGQMITCPGCAATFQAPSLPSTGPLPTPEPLVPPPSDVPRPAETFTPAPDTAATSSTPPAGTLPSEPAGQLKPAGEYARSFTIHLRQEVMTLIPPIGMLLLLILSFFPWRLAAEWITLERPTEWTMLNLWQLAFTRGPGHAVFLLYVLLLIIAAPVTFLTPLLHGNLLPTPAPLRPYLRWSRLVVANLTLAAWVFFLIHYVQCTFLDPIDPATIWMKVAFRLHTLIVIAAFLDIWLARRKRQGLPEVSMGMRW